MAEELTPQEKQACKARLCGYQCYLENGRDMPAAIAAFNERWNSQFDENSEDYIGDVRKLIKAAVKKLETRFTLRTLKPPGPPEKIPKATIIECGDIIAKGHLQPCSVVRNGVTYEWLEHRYFTSLRDAICRSEALADILEQYDADTSYLRRKLRKHCRGLTYHGVHMRQLLSKKIMQQRVLYGKEMLSLLQADEDMLLDVHWMDECSIWVGKDLIADKLHVWSYRADTEGQPPEPNPLFNKKSSFKISILLVVNGRTGCTHVEVLTGTSRISPVWRHTPGMQATMTTRAMQYGDARYKVS